MAVIGINYSGGNYFDDEENEIPGPIVYESVDLYTLEETYLFNSGNFVKDWYDAKSKYINELYDDDPRLSQSSRVDHFIMDGAKFDSAYLHSEKGDKLVLKYLNNTQNIFEQKEIIGGWEFFVPEGTTPTWEEFKEMVK